MLNINVTMKFNDWKLPAPKVDSFALDDGQTTMSFMTESKTQIQLAMDTPMESTWTPEILGVAMMATKLESTWIILDAIKE